MEANGAAVAVTVQPVSASPVVVRMTPGDFLRLEVNEVAVGAFLERRLSFDRIHAVNLKTLETVQTAKPDSLEALLALDGEARAAARGIAARWAL